MTKKNWTFSPYNQEEYKKSKNRVMFVGADPNAEKIYKGKIIKTTDMGDWFRKRYEGYDNVFYQRTVKMLAGVLPNIEDQGVDETMHGKWLVHMRFIDLKATPGVSQAKTDEVREYLETGDNAKQVSNYFTDPKTFPHFVILLGGHVHKLFFEFRKNKKLSFHEKSRAVCMPHPSYYVHYEILDRVAREELNSKFKLIKDSDFLWKWHYKAKINTKKTPSEIIKDESYWSKISK